jgi:quercetin dioxygenase-like cupin family protein
MLDIPSRPDGRRDPTGASVMSDRKKLWLAGLLGGCLMASPPAAYADPPHAFEAGWQGAETCELLYRDETMRIGRCTFPPGVGHERHYHDPHFGYVLEGGVLRINDQAGERVVTTRTGDSWSTTERTEHEAVNIGDTTTRYLIVEKLAD